MSGVTVAQAATIGTPVLVAALGLLGTLWAKSMTRRTDDATVRKTHAEAVAIEVNTARGLVEQIKEMMADQRVDYEARLATTRAEVQALNERTRATETRQHMLMAALVAHAPWDEAAWAALKASQPDYPPPPPLKGDGNQPLRGDHS